MAGTDAGHDLVDKAGDLDQFALPLGGFATLDTHKGTLSVESVVC